MSDYSDPDFQPGCVVADLDGGPDDRRTWGYRPCEKHEDCPDFVEMWGFDVSADDDYYPHTERFRSDLPVRLGLVDPATGRLTR